MVAVPALAMPILLLSESVTPIAVLLFLLFSRSHGIVAADRPPDPSDNTTPSPSLLVRLTSTTDLFPKYPLTTQMSSVGGGTLSQPAHLTQSSTDHKQRLCCAARSCIS
jgi:hypothetical protein